MHRHKDIDKTHLPEKTIQTQTNGRRVVTLKVGAMTRWIRDILAIILMAKIISLIY